MALVPGVRPIVEVAGRVFTDLDNLKILKTYCNANNNATARLPSATSGYQVPVGKKFTVLAIRSICITTGLGAPTLNYHDADVGFNSATALTNPVYECGLYPNYFASIDGDQVGVNGWQEVLNKFEVPASKYFGVAGAGATISYFYGYETTA